MYKINRCGCGKLVKEVIVVKKQKDGWTKMKGIHEDGTIHKWKTIGYDELCEVGATERMFASIEEHRPGTIKRLTESQHRTISERIKD